MILEMAVLDVRPGAEARFEEAMREAQPLIRATPGFEGIEVRPCIERPGRYLLLVRWRRLEDHTEGFRGSKRYARWRELLHRFYEPFPTVEHYTASIVE
jgi:heme-degrading monooxygenase HmoA